MQSIDPEALSAFFKEGMDAREAGLSFHDNPYAAGSSKRREWSAGYCATAVPDDGGELHAGTEPDKGAEAGNEPAIDPDPDEDPHAVRPE